MRVDLNPKVGKLRRGRSGAKFRLWEPLRISEGLAQKPSHPVDTEGGFPINAARVGTFVDGSC